MARVQLQGLHKEFGNVVALDRLDLDVGSGEFVSLLGPSGCGKTTALRIVAGFESPDNGNVLVNGADVVPLAASKRNMGMVFQAYSLFPNMTAQGNVEFPMRIRRRQKDQRSARALELLELVGLERQAARYPRQLSGGQQQRVALARALALEPSVLLLDEPLSALDAKVRVQLREEVRRLQLELGITTLYVTHDQEEALSVSDRVAVMSEGKLEQVGTPAEIYGQPRTPFVAGFVGTINRLDVTVVSRADKTVRWGSAVFTVGDGAVDQPDGAAVTMYLRPEDVRLELLSNGSVPSVGLFEAKVTSITFLGPVTRIGVASSLGPLLADVSSATALGLAIDSSVAVGIDAGSLRTLKS
ncbi:MAG: ABC transporter ATP-binding protein [Acidimicrobiales bacterium]